MTAAEERAKDSGFPMKLPRPLIWIAPLLAMLHVSAAEPASMDLYLLVGQSNMAGRGKVTEADRTPDPRIFVLNRENTWANQGEPLHFDKAEAGVGLGFTFGKLAADARPGVTIGLIPCAVGGTPISRWKPGADLYEKALARARIAVKSGRLKGILWHQGESDSNNAVQAEGYAEKLAEIVRGFRRDLDASAVPFVAGELGEFLYTRTGDKSPAARIVNAQIDTLPKLVPHTAVARSTGLGHKGDQLHFSSEALKEFGKRYFEALQSINPPAKAGGKK